MQVWDVTPARPALKYIIHTFSSVGRIKWRPHFKFHIASTAIVVDRNINVWDIRRPYIPYAYFKGHKDISTDIKWKSDPQYLLSCGRVCVIVIYIIFIANYYYYYYNFSFLQYALYSFLSLDDRDGYMFNWFTCYKIAIG